MGAVSCHYVRTVASQSALDNQPPVHRMKERSAPPPLLEVTQQCAVSRSRGSGCSSSQQAACIMHPPVRSEDALTLRHAG
jgi:hypothetical protein